MRRTTATLVCCQLLVGLLTCDGNGSKGEEVPDSVVESQPEILEDLGPNAHCIDAWVYSDYFCDKWVECTSATTYRINHDYMCKPEDCCKGADGCVFGTEQKDCPDGSLCFENKSMGKAHENGDFCIEVFPCQIDEDCYGGQFTTHCPPEYGCPKIPWSDYGCWIWFCDAGKCWLRDHQCDDVDPCTHDECSWNWEKHTYECLHKPTGTPACQ